jgi:Na+/H+ antiporter NhaC
MKVNMEKKIFYALVILIILFIGLGFAQNSSSEIIKKTPVTGLLIGAFADPLVSFITIICILIILYIAYRIYESKEFKFRKRKEK